jgi:DnaK suppressor protein
MNKTIEHKYTKNLERELTSLEKSLLKTLRRRLDRARSVSSHGPTEFMDMAADGEVDDFAARIAESDSATIDEIEEALRLLKEGEYGICQHCGRRISDRRLKARPFSILCLKCKEKAEASDKIGSHRAVQALGEAYADVGLGDDRFQSDKLDEAYGQIKSESN